jgi:hypothetical protein
MMEIHTDSVFSTVDRISRRLGPVNSLITLLADRVIPQAIARAATASPNTCPPPGVCICSVTCEYDPTCCSLGDMNSEVIIYAGLCSQCPFGFQARCSLCTPDCGTCNE